MLLGKLYGWKIGFGALCIAGVLTGCASTGTFFTKMKPSSIRRAWNKSRTGLEEPEEVHQSYAKWQEHQGNLIEARQSYEFVLKGKPRSIDAILGLARLDQLAGQTQKAEEMISRAQAIAPNDPMVLSALGQFYISQGRFSEATDVLQQAAIISPNDTAIQYELGVSLARMGDLDKARPYFVRTVGEAEAHYNIAYILNEKGQSVAAEQELMASLQKKPTLQSSQVLLEQIRRQHMQTMLAGGYGATQQQFAQQAALVQQAVPARPLQAGRNQSFGTQAPLPAQQMQPGAVQQVQAQFAGQPQRQVVEAYWQAQNGRTPAGQVTHAAGTVVPQNRVSQNTMPQNTVIQNTVIQNTAPQAGHLLPQIGGAFVPQAQGAAPLVQQQIVAPQTRQLEQWNPQAGPQR